MQGITLCLIVYNEAATIRKIIQRCKPYVSEVLVMDGSSTDGTREIAEELADRVVVVPYTGSSDIGGHKQFCIDNARNYWMLFIDGDEMPEIGLLKGLDNLIQKEVDGFEFPRKTYVEGVLFDLFDDWQTRLINKTARWPEGLHTKPHVRRLMRYDNHCLLHFTSLERMEKNVIRYQALAGDPAWDPGFNRRNLEYARKIVELKDIILSSGLPPKQVVARYSKIPQIPRRKYLRG